MDTPFVRLENYETMYAKKQILTAEMSFLKMVKRLRTFKALRKLELTKKNLIKNSAKDIRVKVNLLTNELPKVEFEEIKLDRPKERKVLTLRKRDVIESELEDIKRKLDRLDSD